MSFWKIAETVNSEDVLGDMENSLNNIFPIQNNFISETKVISAIEELNEAAKIADEAGQESLACLLTDLITKIANDCDDFKVIIPLKITPDEMVENYKTVGWPFPKPKKNDDTNNIEDDPDKPRELMDELELLEEEPWEVERGEQVLSRQELKEMLGDLDASLITDRNFLDT